MKVYEHIKEMLDGDVESIDTAVIETANKYPFVKYLDIESTPTNVLEEALSYARTLLSGSVDLHIDGVPKHISDKFYEHVDSMHRSGEKESFVVARSPMFSVVEAVYNAVKYHDNEVTVGKYLCHVMYWNRMLRVKIKNNDSL